VAVAVAVAAVEVSTLQMYNQELCFILPHPPPTAAGPPGGGGGGGEPATRGVRLIPSLH
jgi:hypothetical protein